MIREPLKIVAISDLHGFLPEDLPVGDVLCITGDIIDLDVQRDTIESIAWLCTKFFPWIESLPYRKVFMVAGNHDFVFETLRTDSNGQHRKGKRLLRKLMAPAKLVLLDDNEFLFEGYRFYGSPWCSDLANWAFYADHEELVQKFSKIPNNTDVLLTHCPPRVLNYGAVLQSCWSFMRDFGCDELREAVYAKKPRLHIFGHVHSGDHSRAVHDGTMYCNVSIMDENYQPTYYPQIFTLTHDNCS